MRMVDRRYTGMRSFPVSVAIHAAALLFASCSSETGSKTTLGAGRANRTLHAPLDGLHRRRR